MGRLQLRRRDHHQRRAGEGRHLHVDPHRGVRVEIRETKLGREEFTRDIPNVSREGAAEPRRERHRPDRHLRASRATSWSARSSPKSKSELTPEEKLLHAIFGRAGEDVKNDSLEVPSGVEGIVIDTQRFSRRMSLTEDERKAFEKELKDTEQVESVKIADEFKQMIKALEEALGGPVLDPSSGKPLGRDKDPKALADESERFKLEALDIRSPDRAAEARKVVRQYAPRIESLRDEKDRTLNSLKRGDELPSRRAADGQGLHRHQAGDLGRRQDGRPPRQQGRHRQDPARGGHAVPGGRHAGGDPAQPAGRAEPHERGPDSRDAPGLGRGEARLPGGHPGLRRRQRGRRSASA